eukprot:scaffold32174_cov107-Skeletonema_marinoi.AAC.2
MSVGITESQETAAIPCTRVSSHRSQSQATALRGVDALSQIEGPDAKGDTVNLWIGNKTQSE